MMSADDVLRVLDLLEEAGVKAWVDGGWAVDALLGEQTREHDDLDLAVSIEDVGAFTTALEGAGFERWRTDAPGNWVVSDARDRRVDVHFVDFAGRTPGEGREYYGERGILYDVGSLEGEGVIAGRTVPCPLPDFLVLWHTGYEHDADDAHDVLALCARFGLDVPQQYRADAGASSG